MRIIDITHPPQSLWIGREGENTFRPVSFECANWFVAYPDATIAAYYQPYGANDPYPLVLVEDGTKRIWHPLLNELVKGDGELQIVLMQGDTVGTSAIIPTKVDRSLISNADHPASESPSWAVEVVQDVKEQADRAEAAADRAEEAYDPAAIADAVEDYLDEHPVSVEESDPTVPAWAKQPTKPTYTAQEVGALPSSYTPPVESVNGKTGKVNLNASDVHALPDSYTPPVESVNGMTGAVNLDANDVGAVSTGTYTTEMALVHTELGAKLNTADLVTALDDVNGITYVLALNGATVTLDRPFVAVANSLLSTARRVMFVVILAESGGDPVEFLNLTPTLLDTSNRQLWLEGIYDGSRYTAELTAASASSTMTGTLVVESIVTETWVENKGYQTAQQVQTAISPLQTKAITDTGGYFSTDTVDGALQEIGAELAGVNTLIGSGVIS